MMRKRLFYQLRMEEVPLEYERLFFLVSYFLEKPLVFGDIQGGFYLLGFGLFVAFIVHLVLILRVKLCGYKIK